MVAFGGLVGLALLALWLYCIFDVISSENSLVRNLPKLLWLLIVIFLPSIGSIAWLILGRPAHVGFRPGDTTYRTARRPMGAEDRPGFGRPVDQPDPEDDSLSPIVREREEAARLHVWEQQLRRREEELRRREQGEGGAAPAG